MIGSNRDQALHAALIAGLLLGGVAAWIAIFALGRVVAIVVASVGVAIAGYVGWWLHTWSERNAKLPRAMARRSRGRR